MVTIPANSPYDAEYYHSGCGPNPYERTPEWLSFFGALADGVVRMFRPRRVLDAGCAWGFLVESLWDRGVETDGFDISAYAISQARPDMASHVRVGTLLEPITERYDLITCVEVLEHLTEVDAHRAIDNLTSATDTILFSSTPSDFEEPTHLFVQPPLVWIDLFSARGFNVDLLADCSFLAPHAMVFRRAEKPLDPDVRRVYSQLVRHRILSHERAHALAHFQGLTQRLEGSVAELREINEQLNAANGQLHTEGLTQLAEAERLHIELGAALQRINDFGALAEGQRREQQSLRAGQQSLRVELDTAYAVVRRLEDALAETNLALAATLDATRASTRDLADDIDVLKTSKFWKLKLRLRKVLRRGGA